MSTTLRQEEPVMSGEIVGAVRRRRTGDLDTTVTRLLAENERLRALLPDAAYLARLARSSSWPGEMAERVERAAERVIAAADSDRKDQADG